MEANQVTAWTNLQVLIIISTILVTGNRVTGCPSVCSCRVDFHVFCSGVQLWEIPHDFPSNTQMLNLGSNQIHFVDHEYFVELRQLVEIHLDRNLISVIPPKAFHPLKFLKILDIRFNRIKIIPSLAFTGLEKLERLLISNNRIHSIEEGALLPTPFLQHLDMYNNRFVGLPANLFQAAGDLRTLYIGKCQLYEIDQFVFRGLQNLTVLDLSENTNLEDLRDLVFSDLVNLQSLLLHGGGLKRIHSQAFIGLGNLKELRIDHNLLSHTPTLESLGYMKNLQSLRLDSNLLTSIHYSVLQDLSKLKRLQLDSNKWRCECSLLNLLSYWPKSRPDFITAPGLRCYEPPSFKDIDLWNVPKQSLADACLRTVKDRTSTEVIVPGSDMNLECTLALSNGSYLSWYSPNMVYVTRTSKIINGSLSKKFSIEEDGSLTLIDAQETDIGPYICSVTYQDGATAVHAVVLYKEDDGKGSARKPQEYAFVILLATFAILTILICMLLLLVVVQRRRKHYNGPRLGTVNPFSSVFAIQRPLVDDGYTYAYADGQVRPQPQDTQVDAYAIGPAFVGLKGQSRGRLVDNFPSESISKEKKLFPKFSQDTESLALLNSEYSTVTAFVSSMEENASLACKSDEDKVEDSQQKHLQKEVQQLPSVASCKPKESSSGPAYVEIIE